MSFLKVELANNLRGVVKKYQKKLTNEEIAEILYDVLRWIEETP